MRTSFHHQPEAQHPNFQLSTSWQADYPIFRGEADMHRGVASPASVVDDPKRACAAEGTPATGDCACPLARSHSSIKENQYPGTQ